MADPQDRGRLQVKSVRWAKRSLWGVILGIGAVSLATPFVSPRIFEKWFTFPEVSTSHPCRSSRGP
jgi:cytochrome d ubiquinol oxidase subunit II